MTATSADVPTATFGQMRTEVILVARRKPTSGVDPASESLHPRGRQP